MACNCTPTTPESFRYAYIFDFDGVLVDSMMNYARAFDEVFFRDFGIHIDQQYTLNLGGHSIFECGRILCEKYNLPNENDEVGHRLLEHYVKTLEYAEPIKNNMQLAHTLLDAGFKVGVVSGSDSKCVLPFLKKYGLLDRLGAVVTADQLSHSKPDPEGYLTAAARLGVDPKDCIVVEDTQNGWEAARAAGMKVLVFTDNR